MQITLEQVGKKFNRQWLFTGLSFIFKDNASYAITGNNGSGKSTLLQLLYGFQSPSKGSIIHFHEQAVQPAAVHAHAAFVAPYLELPEELTLIEMLQFHFQFKEKAGAYSLDDMITLSRLEGSRDKQIRFFSSGMKQRLKLALAFFSSSPLLLLDEPCSNLDAQGIAWYRDHMKELLGQRTVIIASNQEMEFDFCDEVLKMADYQ